MVDSAKLTLKLHFPSVITIVLALIEMYTQILRAAVKTPLNISLNSYMIDATSI